MRIPFLRRFGAARRSRAHSPSTHRRRLQFESFEPRRPLCGDLADVTMVEEVSRSSFNSIQTSQIESTVAALGLFDTTAIANWQTGDGTSSTATPGLIAQQGQPNEAPVLVEFTASQVIPVANGVLWHFAGSVTDDHLTQGVTVYFGGLLQGRTATVDPSTGTFSLTIVLPAGISGTVSAVAVDTGYMVSNVKTVLVP